MFVSMLKTIFKEYRRKENEKCVKRTALKCGEGLKIHGKTIVTSNTELGDNVSFNGMTIIGHGRCVIGNNFHCAQDCYIITDTHDYDNGDALPYDSRRSIARGVIIEDNVWFGVGVKVLPGAYIHEGVIVQAGAVVMGDVPALSIVGGIPAKPFKKRNEEHYYKLKKERKFV